MKLFIDLDYTKEISKPKLYLATPTRKIIASLHEANPVISYKVNNVNEMTFEIPALIEEDFKNKNPDIVRNSHLDLIKERYLILVEYQNKKEWFLIIKKSDIADEQRDYVKAECFSLGYELKDDDIDYNVESSTLLQILCGNDINNTKGILYNTKWTIGYIDNKYDKIYRDFVFDGTVLGAILKLPEIFNCIIEFDTEQKKINIYHKDNYGKDTGIVFSYNKYLKSVIKEKDTDKSIMCTRLKVIGKDGISIEGVNPTGKNYIDDFTYFMYPFEMNKKGGIIKHSNYMSDDLCVALVNYKIKILENKSKFRDLVGNKDTYKKLKFYKEQELQNLKLQLKIFNDKLIVAQSSGNPTSEIQNLKRKIENDIKNKNQELLQIQNMLKSINEGIEEIQELLLEKNNFSNKQLEELYVFVIADKIEIQTSNELDLYKEGLKKLKEKSKPKVNINIDLIDFMKCIEAQHMWGKLKLGDKVRVQYPLLSIDEKIRYGIDDEIGGDI